MTWSLLKLLITAKNSGFVSDLKILNIRITLILLPHWLSSTIILQLIKSGTHFITQIFVTHINKEPGTPIPSIQTLYRYLNAEIKLFSSSTIENNHLFQIQIVNKVNYAAMTFPSYPFSVTLLSCPPGFPHLSMASFSPLPSSLFDSDIPLYPLLNAVSHRGTLADEVEYGEKSSRKGT